MLLTQLATVTIAILLLCCRCDGDGLMHIHEALCKKAQLALAICEYNTAFIAVYNTYLYVIM